MDLIPDKATYRPDEPIGIEIFDAEPGLPVTVEVHHLDRLVARAQTTSGFAKLPPLPVGGYGVQARAEGGFASTAVDVLPDPLVRPRYGFVADFAADRDLDAVVHNVRRLHLSAVQFYDWAYRHADLLPPTPLFTDPLGRALSLETVRSLASRIADVGALPFGYAAVYAAGLGEWSRWEAAGLFHADGSPWELGTDFLRIVDPSDPAWSRHLAADLRKVASAVGFAGFHLDQYGAPKRALRAGGREVDLAGAFPDLIRRLRRALPGARLIFNNVNDFPTWTTASAPVDAVYIEVWAPHDELRHLAELVRRAREAGTGKPVILAAYLSTYASATSEQADWAARYVMAAIFSSGAFHLLAGEDGAVLTEAYYVRNHRAGRRTTAMLRRWYDFAVRYGDLLHDHAAVEVTRSWTGGINEELVVSAPAGVRVSTEAEPNALWVRVVETSHGLVVHLINLADQPEVAWDAPKSPCRDLRGVRLRLLRTGKTAPRFAVADPDRHPELRTLTSRHDDGYDEVVLPPLGAWSLVLVQGADAD